MYQVAKTTAIICALIGAPLVGPAVAQTPVVPPAPPGPFQAIKINNQSAQRPAWSNGPALPYWMQTPPAPFQQVRPTSAATAKASAPTTKRAPANPVQTQPNQPQYQFFPGWGWVPLSGNAQNSGAIAGQAGGQFQQGYGQSQAPGYFPGFGFAQFPGAPFQNPNYPVSPWGTSGNAPQQAPQSGYNRPGSFGFGGQPANRAPGVVQK